MKVIIQRVKNASCIVENKIVGSIEHGIMLLVGFTHTDSINVLNQMAKKIANLRIFEDENGKMNLNLASVSGSILSISQFTLYADTQKGNRPSFVDSMRPEYAKPLYEKFNQILRDEYHFIVEEGIFGADMALDIICDGPVTIQLEF